MVFRRAPPATATGWSNAFEAGVARTAAHAVGRPLAVSQFSTRAEVAKTQVRGRRSVAIPELVCRLDAGPAHPIQFGSMKVLLANPRGFCAGVNMAIDVVDQVLQIKGPPVYVYHEIVHNKHVVNDFRDRGVTFVDDIEEVPEGGVVVYSAHGISPDGSRRRRSGEGWSRSTRPARSSPRSTSKSSASPSRATRSSSSATATTTRPSARSARRRSRSSSSNRPRRSSALQVADPDKLAYVTQTTLSVADAERIIAALQAKFPNIKAPPKEDICYATTNRQNAVTTLSPEVDLVLVIGSKNSSNSQRLVDTARELGRRRVPDRRRPRAAAAVAGRTGRRSW